MYFLTKLSELLGGTVLLIEQCTIMQTLAARGAGGTLCEFPSLTFAIIVSFMISFRRISDSRFTWIHDFEELVTEFVGPVLFSAEHLICRHVQTDRRTN